MTRFGDLLGGVDTVVTPITTPAPVVEPPDVSSSMSEFFEKQKTIK